MIIIYIKVKIKYYFFKWTKKPYSLNDGFDYCVFDGEFLMKLTFLCNFHRQKLEARAEHAVRFWQDGFDTAQFYMEQRLWSEALSHAGCAFEIAEILMTKREIDYEVACEWFYQSTILLASTLFRLNGAAESSEIIRLATERFERELNQLSVDRNLLLKYISQLHCSSNLLSFDHMGRNFAGKSWDLSSLH